jgi:hypothetical protein
MRLLFLFLLLSNSIFSQVKPIEVKINSISIDDSNPKSREYNINYHIQNLTEKEISFFLTPNTLIANAASSMTLFTVYKIYINGVLTALDGPFFEKYGIDWETILLNHKDYNSPEARKVIEKVVADYKAANDLIVENYKKNGGTITDEKWILENENLKNSKIILKPNETKTFVINTNWNKNRYFKQDDLEYYLDEKDNYQFEMTLDLKKTAFKSQLSNDEFNKIIKDKNFIEGIFTSNKIEINFK